MSILRSIYRKFIRKICNPIVYEIEQCKNENHRFELRIAKLEEIVSKNSERLNSLCLSDKTRLTKLEENIQKNNVRLNSLERSSDETRLIKLEDNIRKNNQRINELEKADSNYEMYLVKLRNSMEMIQKNIIPIDNLTAENSQEVSDKVSNLVTERTSSLNAYSKIDYFDFENHFRGSRQNVKERQKMYIPYFLNCVNVLDIGCGRGEFLELLKENGIPAKGVDSYNEYAEYCRMKELDVVCGDGIEYLMSCERLDGIIAAQVVEHLDTNQIVTLCENAYQKLEEGGLMILETPNPKALSIYFNEFYMDPSHIKPVHPETLKYLTQKAGFKEVEIIYTEISRVPKKIPLLELNVTGNLQEFNSSIYEVSELLYGSRDYAIIARK